MAKSRRLLFALFLVAAACLLRGPGLEKKIWNVDEAVTFTMAQQILTGQVPYRDAVDQRPPLAPWLQAAVFAVAGDWNLRAQHTALALMIGLTAVLLWLTARRLGDEATGVAAALWLTLLCVVLPTVRDTMPAHVAWYLIFFSCAGFWCLAHAWHSGRMTWAAAAGAAFSLSFLAKQPGVLDFGVALVLGAIGAWADPGRRKQLAGQFLALLVGFAVPVLGAGIYFAAHGAWSDFVYYTWTYNNTLYVPEIAPRERWATMRIPFILAWGYHPAVVVAGGLAGLALFVRAPARLLRLPRDFDLLGWLILGWCAAGLISTTLSGRDFSHYSIQLIPGLSLACGWLTAQLIKAGWGGAGSGRIRRAVVLVVAALLAGWLLAPLPARIRAFNLPEPGTDAVAQIVRRHTGPRDRIFVWGYTPEVYPLSERLPATRFLYNTFLTGLIPWTNLDPLKDTAYAVVPGAWDKFLADWKNHPPALVADGRTQRGFLKYPLAKQTLLWPLIERDYAEIEIAEADKLGYWFFQRLESAPPSPRPAGLVTGPEVQLLLGAPRAGRTARVTVQASVDTSALELYLDGTLYRRLACSAGTPANVAFFIAANDWADGPHRVQVVAVGPSATRLASAEQELKAVPVSDVIGGPPLEFDGRSIAALESSNITGGPILLKKEAPHWDAHAPSRLVYPWLPGMNSLAFCFGVEEMALDKLPPGGTDGVEVVIQVEDQSGRVTQIYRRYLDRELGRRAIPVGRVVDSVPLPKGGSGRIIMLMTPGPRSDVAFDWSYWSWIRADRSAVALLASDRARYPLRIESPVEPRQAEFNGHVVTVTEAPASIEFAATPDLGHLTGEFGLLDTAWLGEEKTGPVDFVIALRQPDGSEARVFERTLDPANVADDRGVKSFSFLLPQPAAGTLRFSARPKGPPRNAHAFWGGLSVILLRTSLQFVDETSIPALPSSAGRFGFANTEEDGKPCLVAHAPATLVYAWREGMTHLTAEYGLISGAYTKNQTEGVVFVVETVDASGTRREIFRRHLAPTTQLADRGAQVLSVEIPPVPGGQLILSTLPPASGNLNAAWSYWRSLRVAP